MDKNKFEAVCRQIPDFIEADKGRKTPLFEVDKIYICQKLNFDFFRIFIEENHYCYLSSNAFDNHFERIDEYAARA